MRFAGITLANYMDGQDESMMAKTGIQTRGQERMSGNKAQYQTELADLQGQLAVAQAEAGASAARAQGQAAGQSAIASGIGSAVGSIGSGAIRGMNTFNYAGGPGSSGTPMGAGGGNVGGYGTLGPNYGIYQG